MSDQEIDIAWASGLFEGEGCLTISGSKYPCARMKLNSTDEDVVRRFHQVMGVGQVREERAMEKRGWKRQWEWYVANQDGVLEAIDLIYPLLGDRRRLRADELRDHVQTLKARRHDR